MDEKKQPQPEDSGAQKTAKPLSEKRKAALLRHFKTLHAIREADVAALSEIVPRTVAETIYTHYHPTVPTP